MTSRMTVGKKFSLACAALVVLTIVLGVFSITSISSIQTNLQAIVVDSLPGVSEMGTLDSALSELRGNFWKYLASDDKAVMAAIDQSNESLKQTFQEHLTSYEKTVTLAEDRQLFANIKPAWDRYLASWEEVASLKRAGKTAEARARYMAVADPAHKAARQAVQAEIDWNKKSADKNSETASTTVSRSRLWSSILLIGSVVVGGLLAFVITRSVNRAMGRAIAELSEGADQVASAASQVSSSSQSLAQGSSEQAASLEETSASSEEINSMARKNTDNSRVAAQLVTQSQQKFVQTNQSLDQMVVSMGEINAQSDRISKIIKVIDEIAFQTNILALNAAVEAARAGEAGMGFAVVADEVRNLAQRCAQAAKDTSALIEESIAKSNDGKTKVDQVAAAIRAITEESAKVKTLVDEVNLGSEEQARGIEQIGKAIAQMEQVTQKTAANAEESASAAEELNAQSETLKEIVERLNTMVGGSEANSGHTFHPVHRPTGAGGGKGPAPSRPGGSRPALSSARKAVLSQPKSPEYGTPLLIARGASQDAFPLDEHFKEF
jgi:methyl-accepting chemotaxis protein/methyl-accepting chemotaxis protein-1 (serine sensor receptor)